MARTVEGLPRPPFVPGVVIEPYRNDWAEEFTAVEAAAMEGLAAFREMGQPTGYEGAEGFDAMVVARDAVDGIRGFAQAMLPEAPTSRRWSRSTRTATPSWRSWASASAASAAP
jgi:hypothetical protein